TNGTWKLRYDPDNSADIPCGIETASATHDAPSAARAGFEPGLGSHIDATFPEASGGDVMAGSAPYRTIGLSQGALPAPAASPRFLFYHLDHLGSPRVVTDSSGNKVSEHHYMPFGEELPVQAQASPSTRQFTGHERDSESG